MARENTSNPTAIYRNVAVKQFDLQHYGTLRRGLTAKMRAQTVGAQTLRSATPEVQQKYLRALNDWRNMTTRSKASAERVENPVEEIFRDLLNDPFYTAEEKTVIATAGLKLKTMDHEQVIQELLEGLNARDRKRSSDFYKGEYYLEADEFDPLAANDDMLREMVSSGIIDGYPQELRERTIREYIKRMHGGETEAGLDEYSSIRASYKTDMLSLAASIVGINMDPWLMD